MSSNSLISELTKKVRKVHPKEWLLRHNIERKVRNKLPPLPGSTSPRRRVKHTASEILNQSAGVVFVALFVMFCVTIFVTILSFILWYILEQFGESLSDIVSNLLNIRSAIWDVVLAYLLEDWIPPVVSKMFVDALTNPSGSLKTYNGSATQ